MITFNRMLTSPVYTLMYRRSSIAAAVALTEAEQKRRIAETEVIAVENTKARYIQVEYCVNSGV